MGSKIPRLNVAKANPRFTSPTLSIEEVLK